MNLSIVALLIYFPTLILTPAKYTVNPHQEIVSKTHIAAADVWTTDWEAVPDWSSQQSDGMLVYSYNRSMPEINQATVEGGAVVVFAKGYDFEGFSQSAVKPLNLPFYLMTSNPHASGTYAWYSQSQIGSVQVGLKMDASLESFFSKSYKDIRFRYFVLSKAFMQQHQLTKQALRGMSYKTFSAMVGVTP